MPREQSTPELLATPPARPPAPDATRPRTVIEATAPWWHLDLRGLWRARELIYFLVLRDLKVRYQHTVLGAAWAAVQPAVMAAIFTIFLGQSARDLPYPVYAYTGFLAWNLFASALNGASYSIIGAEGIITKIYFPRLAIPLAAVGGHVADFAVGCVGLVPLMLYYRLPPSPNLLLLPAWALLTVLAGFGVGTLLAALNVKYRDFRHIQPFIVMVWMFSTPSIFIDPHSAGSALNSDTPGPVGTLKGVLLEVNPMNALVELFRVVTFGGDEVPWSRLALATGIVAVFALGGCLYFRRVEDTFADII